MSFCLNTLPPHVDVDDVMTSLVESLPLAAGMKTLVNTEPSGKIKPSSDSSTTLYTTQLCARIFFAVTLTRSELEMSAFTVRTCESTDAFTDPDAILDSNTTVAASTAAPLTSAFTRRVSSGMPRYNRNALASSPSPSANKLFFKYNASKP